MNESEPGEYVPAGENARTDVRFDIAQIGAALGLDPQIVDAAAHSEFGSPQGALLDSRHVQRLAELLLADQPLADREAALLQFGAYTPRADVGDGIGDAPGR